MNNWSSEGATESNSTRPARDAERISTSDQEADTYTERGEAGRKVGKPEAPIGVFDSGAGGLSILSALQQELPDEHYIYFGDTAHWPYGVRSDAEIIELSLSAMRFLIAQGVKLIVIACNTASQAALSTLRATFSIPFVGVVPAVKPATRATKKGRIGIAATNSAAKAIYLRQLIDEFAEGISVYAVGCPELVTLVEHGELEGPEVEEAVRRAFSPLIAEDVDVIVLGCTHFPPLRSIIERITENRVQVIDSGSAVARRVRTVLDSEGLIAPILNGRRNEHDELHPDIFCSGDPVAFSEVASKLLGYPIVAKQTNMNSW